MFITDLWTWAFHCFFQICGWAFKSYIIIKNYWNWVWLNINGNYSNFKELNLKWGIIC
jgi:hypothetical protein